MMMKWMRRRSESGGEEVAGRVPLPTTRSSSSRRSGDGGGGILARWFFPFLLLLLLLPSGTAAAPPRLTALALVLGRDANTNVSVLPTFSPDVTTYYANVSDAVFEVAMGYTKEDAWEARVSVDVTVAPRNSSSNNTGVYYPSNAKDDNATTTTTTTTFANVSSSKVAVAHGVNDVRVTLTRPADPSDPASTSTNTTYVVTVTRLSLATHASLVALSVSPGTLTPPPGFVVTTLAGRAKTD